MPGGDTPGIINYSGKPERSNYGTHHVQVLRTLAPGGIYPFAPQGEQSILSAYKKAIDLAEHYIYIEEQHLWPCGIIENLAAAALRERLQEIIRPSGRPIIGALRSFIGKKEVEKTGEELPNP